MPPPRKVDKLPSELRDWLRSELERRGFAGYEEVADALNDRLAADGSSLRIQKSAIHAFGQEHREFVRLQEEAAGWAEEWFTTEGLQGEAQRHTVLFQMLTSLAFKVMKGHMEEGAAPNPKDLHFIGKMLKDIMASSGMREKLLAAERERLRGEMQAEAAENIDRAVQGGRLDVEAARAAKLAMGFPE